MRLRNTWHKNFLFSFVGAAVAVAFSAPAFADVEICSSGDAFCMKEELPFNNNPMPKYTVTLIPSNNLPHAKFDLSKRAVRVLPNEIKKLNQVLTKHKLPKFGVVSLTTEETRSYCNEAQQFCWFKRMDLANKNVHITDWNDKTTIYKDTAGLGRLFWGEAYKDE